MKHLVGLLFSWIHNDLRVAMVGTPVNLTYEYDVSCVCMGASVVQCVTRYIFHGKSKVFARETLGFNKSC